MIGPAVLFVQLDSLYYGPEYLTIQTADIRGADQTVDVQVDIRLYIVRIFESRSTVTLVLKRCVQFEDQWNHLLHVSTIKTNNDKICTQFSCAVRKSIKNFFLLKITKYKVSYILGPRSEENSQ